MLFLRLSISALLIVIAGIAAAGQTRSIRGNYCGSTYGTGGGTFGFIVGSEQRDFEISFRGIEKARMTRFNLAKIKVGDEFIIRFKEITEIEPGEEPPNPSVISIVGTGKRRTTTPCDME